MDDDAHFYKCFYACLYACGGGVCVCVCVVVVASVAAGRLNLKSVRLCLRDGLCRATCVVMLRCEGDHDVMHGWVRGKEQRHKARSRPARSRGPPTTERPPTERGPCLPQSPKRAGSFQRCLLHRPRTTWRWPASLKIKLQRKRSGESRARKLLAPMNKSAFQQSLNRIPCRLKETQHLHNSVLCDGSLEWWPY